MYILSWRGELPANYTLMIFKNSNDNVTFIEIKLVNIIYKAMHFLINAAGRPAHLSSHY